MSAIEAVFAKLLLVYGSARVSATYRDQDMAVVRGHWAHELQGITPSGIAYGLQNLPPERLPNVLEFKALCCRAPESPQKRLPVPMAHPERVKAVQGRLEGLVRGMQGSRDPKEWAWRLRERELGGDRLTKASRDMWREALARELDAMGVGE